VQGMRLREDQHPTGRDCSAPAPVARPAPPGGGPTSRLAHVPTLGERRLSRSVVASVWC
jgi:hypothetical protein